jgi:hypothetical protein
MADEQPDDEKLLTALREKIKGKMDIAKLLGAFLTGLLTAVFAIIQQPTSDGPCGLCALSSMAGIAGRVELLAKWYQIAALISVISLVAAIILYFATVYAYDRLLMPSRYWDEKFSADILHYYMLRAWDRFFTPATACLAFGLAFLAATRLRLGIVEGLLIGAVAIVVFWSFVVAGRNPAKKDPVEMPAHYN